MKKIEIEVYGIEELDDDVIDNIYSKWYEYCDYGWMEENRESLEQFCDFFEITVAGWSYDTCTYDIGTVSTDNYFNYEFDIEDFKGLRLYKWIINNKYDDLFDILKNKPTRKEEMFTGYYLDDCILQPIYDFIARPDLTLSFKELMEKCIENALKVCRDDINEYTSKEYMIQDFKDNDYMFLSDGTQIDIAS